MRPTDKLRAFVADHPCEPFTQEDAAWLLEHIESLEKAVQANLPPVPVLRIVRDDEGPPGAA